jgi:hypothetical protein
MPCRQVTIPKEGGRLRGLKIPDIRDRVVHGALRLLGRDLAVSPPPPLPRRLSVMLRSLFSWQRRAARRAGITKPLCGSETSIHRFNSQLLLSAQVHVRLPDGVVTGVFSPERMSVVSLGESRGMATARDSAESAAQRAPVCRTGPETGRQQQRTTAPNEATRATGRPRLCARCGAARRGDPARTTAYEHLRWELDTPALLPRLPVREAIALSGTFDLRTRLFSHCDKRSH